MNEENLIRTSKFLSLVLRHQPDAAGIQLDAAGWVKVDELLAGCARAGRVLSKGDLDQVVAENSKKRFEFSADNQLIRASQGHSVEVNLQFEPRIPPEFLYHGTATRFLEAIRLTGLQKMKRHHVHLSQETVMTLAVGSRHGKAVLLTINAGEMRQKGFEFFLSTNGVWLVDHVPAEFIQFP